jgi:hypothetical protein
MFMLVQDPPMFASSCWRISAVSDPGCCLPPHEIAIDLHDIDTRECVCLDVKLGTPAVTLDVIACHIGSAFALMHHDGCTILLMVVSRLEHSARGLFEFLPTRSMFNEAQSV